MNSGCIIFTLQVVLGTFGYKEECAIDVMLNYVRKGLHKGDDRSSLTRDDVIMMNTDLIFAGIYIFHNVQDFYTYP